MRGDLELTAKLRQTVILIGKINLFWSSIPYYGNTWFFYMINFRNGGSAHG
ncbi:hypothetical protein SPLC1_S500570 [Arthrospira platensis C1]|uniref:Uncharacterized protein n=1 Tax=Limnospira indica PCC 8005 TaxID=376219 RepID=A0A9P1NZK3_9CYAN|nr:hypothetical protein SPLC1_S500570 [Arthrospira platensis C1]BAI93675.1 hypothetical protein NIES39_O04280 [Arthrospira platensis NIES-39]CDM95878.1 conserved protein of unknown function [Limnospira indica PCC 8005]